MIPEDPYGEIQMLIAGLPDSASTVVAKSRDFRDIGDIDFAFELLRMAIEKDPAPVLLSELADLLISEGRLDEASEISMRSLELDPTHRGAQRVLRNALLAGLPENALHVADVALRFAQTEPDLTEDILVNAIERAPNDIMLREQLAQFYGSHRRVVDCIAALQGILALDPEHDEAMLMLAAAFIKEGDFPRAQKLLNKARRRGVDSPMLEQLEKKIGDVVQVIAGAKKS